MEHGIKALARIAILGLLVSACGGGGGGGSDTPPSNSPPIASFTATPASGTVPLTVQFNASASTDSGGSIAGYSWNFGDSSAAGSGVTTSHVFQAAGVYTVTLTVTDNLGATGSTTRQVTVSNIAVPNVVGLTQSAATTTIAGAGLVVGSITSATSATVPAGDVVSQNPAAGALVTPGSSVSLVISSGGGSSPPLTVTLSANPTSVNAGDSATLTWSSGQATSCTASGAWSGARATSGSISTGPLNAVGASIYVLTCSNATESKSASVTVTTANAQLTWDQRNWDQANWQ